MNAEQLADRLESRCGSLVNLLELELKRRNAKLRVARKPASKADVLTIFETLRDQEDLEAYLFQEASIEAAKMVMMGYYRLLVALQSEDPEGIDLAGSLGQNASLVDHCRACVQFWPG